MLGGRRAIHVPARLIPQLDRPANRDRPGSGLAPDIQCLTRAVHRGWNDIAVAGRQPRAHPELVPRPGPGGAVLVQLIPGTASTWPMACTSSACNRVICRCSSRIRWPSSRTVRPAPTTHPGTRTILEGCPPPAKWLISYESGAPQEPPDLSASRAFIRSSTTAGSRCETSPPYIATSFTSELDRKLYSGFVAMNSVSTPESR